MKALRPALAALKKDQPRKTSTRFVLLGGAEGGEQMLPTFVFDGQNRKLTSKP